MYEFLGLQPPTKRQKKYSRKRRKAEIYVNVSWSEKKPWLKYIEEEEKSMHCVTGREAAEVDEYIKQSFFCNDSWD